MSTLREALGDYLAMRRALGFKLRSDGVALSSFVSFLDHAHVDCAFRSMMIMVSGAT